MVPGYFPAISEAEIAEIDQADRWSCACVVSGDVSIIVWEPALGDIENDR
jgi:hypothetical protein